MWAELHIFDLTARPTLTVAAFLKFNDRAEVVLILLTPLRRTTHTHTHTRLTTLCPGLPGWVDTRKVKPIWILPKQETVSGSGIGWAVCKSAPRSRQITTPVPHHSVFYRPDALPAAQPTASKHWRQSQWHRIQCRIFNNSKKAKEQMTRHGTVYTGRSDVLDLLLADEAPSTPSPPPTWAYDLATARPTPIGLLATVGEFSDCHQLAKWLGAE